MGTSRRLTTAAIGAAVALTVAGTTVAAAHGGRADREGEARGRPFAGGLVRGDDGPGLRGFGGRLGLGLGLGGDGFVRTETIVDLGEAGFLTRRVDNGTVTGTSEAELSYTLETGEAVTVTADDDTEVLTVSAADSGDGMLRRRMMQLDEIALADIPADAEVVVWSEAGESGQFVVQRVVVRPSDETADAAAEEAAPVSDAAETTEDASASPDASA